MTGPTTSRLCPPDKHHHRRPGGTPARHHPPSTPAGLVANATGFNQIQLQWTPATDTGGVGLAGYRVYRDGSTTVLATVTGTAYADGSLLPSTAYGYQVEAFDGAGNVSLRSLSATATTLVTSVWQSRDIGAVAAAGA